jgi:N-acetylneuraminate synthase
MVIEKHITLARADGGVDSAFSLEPEELTTLCHECHTAWAALGRVDYSRKPSEVQAVRSRRSLYVVRDMAVGEPFTADTVRSIRPGFGLAPKHLPDVLGRRARVAIPRATPLDWTLID